MLDEMVCGDYLFIYIKTLSKLDITDAIKQISKNPEIKTLYTKANTILCIPMRFSSPQSAKMKFTTKEMRS